jgi:hypothetical protein
MVYRNDVYTSEDPELLLTTVVSDLNETCKIVLDLTGYCPIYRLHSSERVLQCVLIK